MRKFALLLILCFTFSLFFTGEENRNLKIKSSIRPGKLSRTQEGEVIFELTVERGITISPQPSFTIEFSPCEGLVFPKNFFTASDLSVEILEEKGHEYLNLKEPIKIPFTVSTDAKRGRCTLQGKIKYFACSLENGWCLKTFSKFSVLFYIRKTTIKKK